MAYPAEQSAPIKRIKDATSTYHNQLEEQMDRLYFGEESISRDQYEQILQTMYGLYKPLENRIIPAVRNHLDTYSYESRAKRLSSDLKTLGWTDEEQAEIPCVSSTVLPTLTDLYQTLGCLYVVEGSELGSSIIRRRFEEMLDEKSLTANAFYRDNPDETRTNWRSFQTLFNNRVQGEKQLSRTISSARKMFDVYRRWLK